MRGRVALCIVGCCAAFADYCIAPRGSVNAADRQSTPVLLISGARRVHAANAL
jgi:hypothetical protein